jgi:hypothetical protein
LYFYGYVFGSRWTVFGGLRTVFGSRRTVFGGLPADVFGGSRDRIRKPADVFASRDRIRKPQPYTEAGRRIRRIADRIRKPADVFGGLQIVFGSQWTYAEYYGPYLKAGGRIPKSVSRKLNSVKLLIDGVLNIWVYNVNECKKVAENVRM